MGFPFHFCSDARVVRRHAPIDVADDGHGGLVGHAVRPTVLRAVTDGMGCSLEKILAIADRRRYLNHAFLARATSKHLSFRPKHSASIVPRV